MDLTQIEHSVPPQYHFWILLGIFLITHIDRIGGLYGLKTRILWGDNPPKEPKQAPKTGSVQDDTHIPEPPKPSTPPQPEAQQTKS